MVTNADDGDRINMPETPAKDNWETPAWLFNLLDDEFKFKTDLAANEHNMKCKYWLGPPQSSALDVRWHKLPQPCFLNPPYSDLGKWADKAANASLFGATIVMLAPATRTGRGWFHDHVIGWASEIRYVRKRIHFVPPPGIITSSPRFDSMVIIYKSDQLGHTVIGRSINVPD